jgi:isopenicillin N synthase-like dioxygenase
MGDQRSKNIPVIGWLVGSTARTSDDEQRVARAVDDACKRSGYFFLTHHGVSERLVSAAFGETRRFYALPLEHKRKFDCSPQSQFLGYRGVGAEKSLLHAGGEACEQYRIGHVERTPAARAIAAHYHEPFGQSMRLFEELVELGNGLMSMLATSLGLEATFFDRYMDAPMHRFGLNNYTVGSGRAIGNSVSYAMTSHVDHAVMTILTQDEPALEVLDADGHWVDVPLMPGALFVFLGDYMQRWSNGRYRAARHQVREVASHRVSLQYKHRPSHATVVAPLRELVDEQDPPRYEAFDTGRQYTELLRSLLGH